MRLSKSMLQKKLTSLAMANAKAWELRDEIAKHCESVYGIDPADVDFDSFIDAVDGGCGKAIGMTADDFHAGMIDCMERKGIDVWRFNLSSAEASSK